MMPDGPGVYGGWPSSGEIGDQKFTTKSLIIIIAKDMMESSGMRGYHCGSTSRGVDTVQVMVITSLYNDEERLKMIMILTFMMMVIFTDQPSLWPKQGSTLERRENLCQQVFLLPNV